MEVVTVKVCIISFWVMMMKVSASSRRQAPRGQLSGPSRKDTTLRGRTRQRPTLRDNRLPQLKD